MNCSGILIGKKIINNRIIQFGNLFDSIIIHNEVLMIEMLSIQLSALLSKKTEIFLALKR